MLRWEMDGIGRGRLELRQVPVPKPEAGEILVEVAAVALNHRDAMVVGSGRGLPLAFPFTPGSDLSGTVVAVGDGATRFDVGDRVISIPTPDWQDGLRGGDARTPSYRTLGGYYPGVLAEYVAFPESWFVAAPLTLGHAEAATLPCAGLTAWFALVERGGVHAGESVLVEGTGGVALFGIQIAVMQGAEVIVVASADKLERAKALGAVHGVDRRGPDWVETVLGLTGDRGADHVLEIVGGAHLGKAVRVVAVGGRVSMIGALDGFEAATPVMPLMLKDVTVQGIGTGHRRALEDLVRAVDRAGLTPVVDSRFPLAELPAAFDRLDAGPFGKVVVEV
ncbi:NAD(P)-dependent alcohol dehydrogenase [Pseudonocardia zijingensis]|uniref:NAD(P)-dependent alcohol dehydrogenase n=1 Tax=Pseudonocardia zijingensis TaxID=153376 RepID=A0ABN1N885_9PSEU